MISFRQKYQPRFQPDWRAFRTVVFESDDWGACEYAPTKQIWSQTVAATPIEGLRPAQNAKLESVEEIVRLGELLEKYPDKNGGPAVITAFFCLANPDFEQIATTGIYHDIAIDQGFPASWQKNSAMEAWRHAVQKGWFFPEFHSRLHHMNPGSWLRLLKETSELGEEARKRFGQEIYYQNSHYPEYSGMMPEAIQEWITPALATFRRLFATSPTAGVTSDATPLTEIIWAANGIKTFCLRNFSIPGAAPLVYHTKPWNNQDASTPMGAWNPETDVVYLSRNVFFEPGFDPNYSFEKITSDIEAVWARNEPAILSSHRLNFISWNDEFTSRGFEEMERLLAWLAQFGDVQFLSTAEVSSIYRDGTSVRTIGNRELIHQPTIV